MTSASPGPGTPVAFGVVLVDGPLVVVVVVLVSSVVVVVLVDVLVVGVDVLVVVVVPPLLDWLAHLNAVSSIVISLGGEPEVVLAFVHALGAYQVVAVALEPVVASPVVMRRT